MKVEIGETMSLKIKSDVGGAVRLEISVRLMKHVGHRIPYNQWNFVKYMIDDQVEAVVRDAS